MNKYKSFLNVLFPVQSHSIFSFSSPLPIHFIITLLLLFRFIHLLSLYYLSFYICLGHFTDDSKSILRIQQQRNLHSDNENTSLGMFQANYQYTPLKEYAAMKNGRSPNGVNNSGYQSK